MISEDICITILKNVNGKVDVGISAPKVMPVHRLEIFEKIKLRKQGLSMNAKNRILLNFLLTGAVAVLTGCAAIQTALEHGSLQVSTKQNESI